MRVNCGRWMGQLLEILLFVCFIAARGEHWGAELLTKDTFGPAIFRTGKPAFINFLKSTSELCYEMKHVWDKLGRYYHGSNIVIADVDCEDVEHSKVLCEQHGIQIYPTLFYYEGNSKKIGDGREYDHNRSYETLKMFAKYSLRAEAVQCNFHSEVGCTEEEIKWIKNGPNYGFKGLKRSGKVWIRDRKKLDVQHKKQMKAHEEKYDSLTLQEHADRTSLAEEQRREAKEMVQQYRDDRMNLTRKIKLVNHLATKLTLEEHREKRRRKLPGFRASEQEIQMLESPEYKQMMEMRKPRVFLSDMKAENTGWWQFSGPKPDDFEHLPHSIFKSPYVYDPTKPMKDQKDVRLEEHELDVEIHNLDKELDEL